MHLAVRSWSLDSAGKGAIMARVVRYGRKTPLRSRPSSAKASLEFKGQLDLERHGGHTPGGVWVRVLQRILALTAAIWHNHKTGQPTLRSLVASGGLTLAVAHWGAGAEGRR
jgi:hypothetical protein